MELFFLFLKTALKLVTGCLSCVVIHELGHLTGGFLSGYIFSSLELFGLKLTAGNGKLTLKFSSIPCLGQCIMYPKKRYADASLLILGGVIANFMTAALFFIFSEPVYALIDLTAAIMNISCFSVTSDGSTFADAKKSSMHMETYNRLMLVYRCINEGCDWRDINPEILEYPCIYLSTLSAELAYYRYRCEVGRISRSPTEAEAVTTFPTGLDRFSERLFPTEEVKKIGKHR